MAEKENDKYEVLEKIGKSSSIEAWGSWVPHSHGHEY
jgi:hypothetical protein